MAGLELDVANLIEQATQVMRTAAAVEAKSASVSNTALGIASWSFTASHLAEADHAYITADGAAVKVLWTGDTATATFGHEIADAGFLEVIGNTNINNISMIRADGTDATVTISLEK